ncbi:hypothetical protein GUJ93_ZPchr0002g26232 [Zizania palustris]|uniref:R13L1/DRL21-like LRR repeat region domain-containing protein n=1 Tax=Zizania palustris TaxID=103762 RepID=A0A8J5VRQ1_ZIZPA|nr:hypothetical protein GUJ93_ZPchr0002g26232 [Zizania palustris]
MQEWTHQTGLAEDVKKLECEMGKVHRIVAEPAPDSLHELKDLICDAEDIMDELDYYRLQQHIEGKGSHAAVCINPEASPTGCMVLATTRRPSVARMIGTMSKVEVNGLDETEFLSLFKSWAFLGSENQEVDSRIASVGKLTCLQELTFKVQDGGNFNISQLASLNELTTLGISQLENVKTKEEAKSARLIDKEHLKELSLSWNDNIMSPETTEDKTRDDVLEGLEPHQNLTHLQLSRVLMVKDCPQLSEFTLFHSNYFHAEQKSRFPSLKQLTIGHCHHIIAWKTLPLEEMRALKKLELIDVPVIEELSVPSLEELVLMQMPSLQSCNGISCQEDLEFSGVNGGFGGCTSLEKLFIYGCPELVSSLVIQTNGNLLLPTSLQHLTINALPENLQSFVPEGLACLKELSLYNSQYLKFVQLDSCKALEYLGIWDCPQLGVLEGLQHLSSLRTLNIEMNPELSCAWDLKLQEQGQGGPTDAAAVAACVDDCTNKN